MKHTQGVFTDGYTGWRAVKYKEGSEIGLSTHEIHFSDDGECVAEVVHGEANAKLIAAAPKLLEAIHGLFRWAEHLPQEANEDIINAQEAYNKATV